MGVLTWKARPAVEGDRMPLAARNVVGKYSTTQNLGMKKNLWRFRLERSTKEERDQEYVHSRTIQA